MKQEKNKKQKIEGEKEEFKEELKEEKLKQKKQETTPKEKAIINVKSLALSPKQCIFICKMIKGKTPEQAIKRLELVIKEKMPVPMKGEIPHRKGKGIMSGRFPKNASKEIIKLLVQLNANAFVNKIENPIIVIAKVNRASRPFKRKGRKAKRVHIYLEVKEKNFKNKIKPKEKV